MKLLKRFITVFAILCIAAQTIPAFAEEEKTRQPVNYGNYEKAITSLCAASVTEAFTPRIRLRRHNVQKS